MSSEIRRVRNSLEEQGGIHRCAIQVSPEMQMRPGDTARCANSAQDVSRCYRLAFFDFYFAHVAIHRDKTLSVIDENRIAVEKIVARRGDCTGAGRDDGLAVWG